MLPINVNSERKKATCVSGFAIDKNDQHFYSCLRTSLERA